MSTRAADPRSDRLDEPYASPARAWYVVFVLGLAVLLSFTDRLILNLIVDDIRADLKLTDLYVSLLQGAGFAFVYAVAGLPMGRIADRSSRRDLIVIGVVVWSLATIACGFAGSFWPFFAFRMVVGLGEAILAPAAASMIADSFAPSRRGRALGAFGIGALLGSGVALTLGGLLLTAARSGALAGTPVMGDLAPWRDVLILAGAPGLLLAPFLMLMREPARHDSEGFQPVRAVLAQMLARRGRVARVCASIGLVAAGDYGLLSWLPALLKRGHELSPAAIGSWVGAAVSGGGVLGCLAAGWISDRIAQRYGIAARRRLMLGAYVFCAASAMLLFSPQPAALIAGLCLWVIGSVAGSVAGGVVLQESVPNEMRATTTAFSHMCSAIIGVGLGPTSVILVEGAFGTGQGALRMGIAIVSLTAALAGIALLCVPDGTAGRSGARTCGPRDCG
jgi:MFS family permease